MKKNEIGAILNNLKSHAMNSILESDGSGRYGRIDLDESLSRKMNNYLLGQSDENITELDVLYAIKKSNGKEAISLWAGITVYYRPEDLEKKFTFGIRRVSNDYEIHYGVKWYYTTYLNSTITSDNSEVKIADNFIEYYNTTPERIAEVNSVFQKTLNYINSMGEENREGKKL